MSIQLILMGSKTTLENKYIISPKKNVCEIHLKCVFWPL